MPSMPATAERIEQLLIDHLGESFNNGAIYPRNIKHSVVEGADTWEFYFSSMNHTTYEQETSYKAIITHIPEKGARVEEYSSETDETTVREVDMDELDHYVSDVRELLEEEYTLTQYAKSHFNW